jgi:hypothetical protein
MKPLCKIIAYSGIAIWFSWMVASAFIGGDAFSGKIEGGKYFLGRHGHYTEVSRNVFTLNRFHGYVAWSGFGIGILAAIAGNLSRRSEKKAN